VSSSRSANRRPPSTPTRGSSSTRAPSRSPRTKILGIDANTLYPQLLSKRTSFVYIERFADSKLAATFLKKGFTGVNGYPEERRSYPQRSVAAQVVGYAGTDNKGLAGLEIEYDRQLAGKPGKQTIVRDPFGRAINVVSATPEREGRSIITTLDHTIQANAESVLRQTVAHWHARSATAVVLDPRTGAVLAMAQAPGYDANNANHVSFALQRNRAITDTFEPGSTFKLVTISGALSTGLVTPETKFTLPYAIPDRRPHRARRGAARDRDVDRRADPLALVERRRGHDCGEARCTHADGVDPEVRLREADRDRLPR